MCRRFCRFWRPNFRRQHNNGDRRRLTSGEFGAAPLLHGVALVLIPRDDMVGRTRRNLVLVGFGGCPIRGKSGEGSGRGTKRWAAASIQRARARNGQIAAGGESIHWSPLGEIRPEFVPGAAPCVHICVGSAHRKLSFVFKHIMCHFFRAGMNSSSLIFIRLLLSLIHI